MINLEQLKNYLGVDGGEQDSLLSSFLRSAKYTVEKVLRQSISDLETQPEIINTAVQYICWQLYFHRDATELKMNEIEKTVAVMLSDLRKEAF